MSYYGVKIGRIPGVYTTWGECYTQIHKHPGAMFKKFPIYDEAQQYVYHIPHEPKRSSTDFELWTDGSAHIHRSAGYGFVLVNMKSQIEQTGCGKVLVPPYTSPHAEIWGILMGLHYFSDHHPTIPSLTVYCDCQMVVKSLNEWGDKRGEKEWSEVAYGSILRDTYIWLKHHPQVSVVHINSHKGHKYNEMADRLAKSQAI